MLPKLDFFVEFSSRRRRRWGSSKRDFSYAGFSFIDFTIFLPFLVGELFEKLARRAFAPARRAARPARRTAS